MMTMRNESMANKVYRQESKEKNDPKNLAKKSRDFFSLLVHLGFFLL